MPFVTKKIISFLKASLGEALEKMGAMRPGVLVLQDAVFIGSDCIDSYLDVLSAH